MEPPSDPDESNINDEYDHRHRGEQMKVDVYDSHNSEKDPILCLVCLQGPVKEIEGEQGE